MKIHHFRISSSVLFVGALLIGSAGCGGTEPVSNAPVEKACDAIGDTPGEAYKRLFAAVKEKNTERIKGTMSKLSQEFAESLADRQKKKVEQVYENGFTATTFAPTLPEIRDERVSGCWAGVEVWNSKDQKWEDVPFANEDGEWKLAVGEMFRGSYKSPGKPRAEIEREAANVARGNIPAVNMMANAPTSNVNINTNSSKYDGPQVVPLPKGK